MNFLPVGTGVLGAQDQAIMANGKQLLGVDGHQGSQGHIALRLDFGLPPAVALVVAQ
ncbi:hypothetical protein D3C86_2081550 [compost metagenome]